MMQQWHRCKAQAKNALLLFRLGDFFEAFYEDAHLLAKELNLTLTQRQKIPMSGVPAHTIESCIEKLMQKGHLVAIADQVESSTQAKGLVKREITRIVSPATHVESSLSKGGTNEFFASVFMIKNTVGLAYTDISTGELFVFEGISLQEILDEVCRISPKEILLSKEFYTRYVDDIDKLKHFFSYKLHQKEKWHFEQKEALIFLHNHFSVQSLQSFGLKDNSPIIPATYALLSHLNEYLHQNISHVCSIKKKSLKRCMTIDPTTMAHLEIVQSKNADNHKMTLFSLIDYTKTPMGKRLLYHWITHPLLQKEHIEKRLSAVEVLWERIDTLVGCLKSVQDIERLMIRVKTGLANPKDLIALLHSLQQVPEIRDSIQFITTPLVKEIVDAFKDFSGVTDLIEKSLKDPAPTKITEGNIFKKGISPELDELRGWKANHKAWLDSYEESLREELQIKFLKIVFHKTFGYCIEVSRGSSDKMPSTFERRQTLTNAERFTSPKLKEFETKILSAEEKILSLERCLFLELRDQVGEYFEPIQNVARALAKLDALLSLAQIAHDNHYVKPEILEESIIDIEGGRHPVVEHYQNESFIPNDLKMSHETDALILLTGPNMAGKSTYIRQTALIVILAQIGSYVPAVRAKIGVVDKIFSRIGASDDLSRGLSTFMVEMTETAHILHNATDKSLVILDEIGRGTSTFDGIAIAWSVAEYLVQTIRAKTLFATHFWELTQLSKNYPQVKNFRVCVQENEDGIVFLHKIASGGTDKSYGIHVASLSGIPKTVLSRAKNLLVHLETKQDKSAINVEEETVVVEKNQALHPILKDLQSMDINSLSPLQALQKIASWQNDL